MGQIPEQASKPELRKKFRLARREFTQDQEIIASLNANLEDLYDKLAPRTVAGYLPFDNEPNIEPFLKSLLNRGVAVLMPISNQDNSLSWVSWNGSDQMRGIFNFLEAQGLESSLAEADLVLVPALAATPDGVRLGKGLGFYDRALSSFSGVKAAVVFDHEVLNALPVEIHDEPVDFVVTELRLIDAR